MQSTNVLISGTNRGIGRGLLSRYLAQPNTVVIAANRDPSQPSSQSLKDLPKGEGSRLILIKLDASVEQDAHDVVKELEGSHGVGHLDLVIANAGKSYGWPTVAQLKIADLEDHMRPNVYGIIWLYQATRPLLQKSTIGPKFIPIGSKAGSLTDQPPVPNAAYGPTKAALNWFIVRMHAEDEWLNVCGIHPGLVDTDLGTTGVEWLTQESGLNFGNFDMNKAMIGVDTSCNGIVKVISEFDKGKHGGRLLTYAGDVAEW
ncbi:hypothetical protein GGR56DRAFT_643382 [Xylariaceae sp. FL0804]|nr:hypothetical protein GGR56DRAFT_643382 [Xylariaceae sp. FL0804]